MGTLEGLHVSFCVRMVNRLSACLPPSLGRWLRNRSWPSAKPTLHYLEFHLTDHCNMNCGGCLHFAPMADRWFADVGRVTADFKRLKAIFHTIREVRVMGGEPLLHPECIAFLRIVRDAFPTCLLTLVTNGLLLARQPTAFWETCRETHARISLSVYPPVRPQLESLAAQCRDEGVPLYCTSGETFIARYVPAGDMDAGRAFRACRGRWFYCPILREGRIYRCAMGCYAAYWNQAAKAEIPIEGGIPIESATGPAILDYLMRPMPTCAYCSKTARVFTWHHGTPELKDWIK